MTAEFTLPNRSVRSTRESPTKEIMTSRCPTILTANPASIAIGGGISSTIQNRTHRHSPPSPSPPPRHSHFLSAANSLDLRFPRTLAKSPTTSPPFLLPLSLTLGYFTANPYYVSDRSSILSPPAFYTPPPSRAPPATNRNDFMNTFMSNFFEKILDCLLIITTTTKICFLQFWKKNKNKIAAKTHEPKRSDENTEQRNRSVESGSPGTCHDAR